MFRPRNTLKLAIVLFTITVSSAFATDVELPNGMDWNRATEQERLAYITGFSNALSLGYVSDEKHLPGNKETFSHRAVAGLFGTSVEQGVAIIDSWYRAHPKEFNTPVLEVLWEQAGKPRLEKSK